VPDHLLYFVQNVYYTEFLRKQLVPKLLTRAKLMPSNSIQVIFAVIEPGVLSARVFILLFGACIGSFLAATAYRIPRGISLLRRSECIHCSEAVKWYGLIPIFGFLLVGGKCKSCQTRVSWHYAAFELLVAALTLCVVETHVGSERLMSLLPGYQFSGTGFGLANVPAIGKIHFSFVPQLVVSLWLLYTGALLTLIDLEFRILPDVITIPGTIFGIALSTLDSERGFAFGVIGTIAGGGGLWLVAYLYRLLRQRDGMGMGDVKYLAMIGAVLGWSGVLWSLMISSLLGSFIGLLISLWYLLKPKDEKIGTEIQSRPNTLQLALPFGPFLAIASFVYSLYAPFFHNFLLPH
jgi:leader peptidase (prepilin peptidase)/N-methyltransferase